MNRLFNRTAALRKPFPEPWVVPPGARPVPDHRLCRHNDHQGLRWTEVTESVGWGRTRTRIVAAYCTDCGRSQTQVRVVYRSEHTITVRADADHTGGGNGALVGGARGAA